MNSRPLASSQQDILFYALIFLVAVVLRIAFAFYFQQFMWGEFRFFHPDTPTYLNSFMNLLNYGSYCFDLEVPDSCLYRLPTYPFFLGINYLAFGDYAWVSVSIIQAIVDAVTCCLAVAIVRQLTVNTIAPLVVAILFVFNPFTIVWVPQQMPETLAVFLVVFSIYLIVAAGGRATYLIVSAGLFVLAVWSKQYILAIVPPVIFFMACGSARDKYIKGVLVFFLAFAFFYSPWIVRNYIGYGQFAPLSGKTTGARHYLADYGAAMKFIGVFYEDNTEHLELIASEGRLVLPDSDFVRVNKSRIDQAVAKAFECGPSFNIRRDRVRVPYAETIDCEKSVAQLFRELDDLARYQMGWAEYYRTGYEAFFKGILKTSFAERSGSVVVQQVLFLARSILLITAFVGIFFVRERPVVFYGLGAIAAWMSTAVVLAFVFRHVEMRYLLMADVLVLILSGYVISLLVAGLRVGGRVRPSHVPTNGPP